MKRQKALNTRYQDVVKILRQYKIYKRTNTMPKLVEKIDIIISELTREQRVVMEKSFFEPDIETSEQAIIEIGYLSRNRFYQLKEQILEIFANVLNEEIA